MARLFTNNYPGKCSSCKIKLLVNDGYVFKNPGDAKYTYVCKSSACMAKLNINIQSEQDQPRKLNTDGSIEIPYNKEHIILLRSMPGAKWNPEKKLWFVSTKIGDLARVIELAEKLQLTIPDQFRKQLEEGNQDSQQALLRTKDLYPFQKIGVKFLSLSERALLADEQGLGKTIQILMSIPTDSRVIVVCPNSLKYNWKAETIKWRPDLKAVVCEGRQGFVSPNKNEIVIINYDILPDWLTIKPYKKKLTPEQEQKYIDNDKIADEFIGNDIIFIADECQRVKNPTSKRSQKVKAISKRAAKVWFVTGTPLENKPENLYGTLDSGDMAYKTFGGWHKFTELFNCFYIPIGNEKSILQFGRPTPEVAERLRRVMIRRLKDEVLKDLPPKTYQNIEIEIDAKLKKELDQFVIQLLLDKKLAKDKKEAEDKMDELLELLEIDDIPSFEQFAETRALLAKSRIPAMIEFIEDYEEAEKPLVVFSAHRAPIDELNKRDGWATITGDTPSKKRQEIKELFQAGKLKGVGLTIAAGGEGLTLTHASTVLFVDLDWIPSKNIQAEDRLHRIGQLANVLVIRMCSKHPLDRHVNNLLMYKTNIINLALTAVSEKVKLSTKATKSSVDIVEETQEQMEERVKIIEQIEKEKEKEIKQKIAKEKISRAVAFRGLTIKTFSVDYKTELLNALEYMIDICDKAQSKDYMGFNKPDSAISRWLAASGLQEDIEFMLLEDMLRKYKVQLNGFSLFGANK